MMARNPFPADQRAVTAVIEITVPELEFSYTSVITRNMKELKALGKIWEKILRIVLSSKENKGTMLNKNIKKGKKEMMIKKAACAEKADT